MVETGPVNEVEYFDRWQRVWDENGPAHQAGGVRRKQLHFHPADTKRFVIVREFDDLDQAHGYLASPERQQRVQAARVVNTYGNGRMNATPPPDFRPGGGARMLVRARLG